MEQRASEHRHHRRVQFYEVDSAGIVHFSWYFRYMEEAEHAMWRNAGLSIAAPGHAVSFPRVSVSFEYHRPLRFEDEFEVAIRVVALSEKTIRYVAEITRAGARIATGSLTVVCAAKQPDGSMKAVPIPPDVAAKLEVAGAQT